MFLKRNKLFFQLTFIDGYILSHAINVNMKTFWRQKCFKMFNALHLYICPLILWKEASPQTLVLAPSSSVHINTVINQPNMNTQRWHYTRKINFVFVKKIAIQGNNCTQIVTSLSHVYNMKTKGSCWKCMSTLVTPSMPSELLMHMPSRHGGKATHFWKKSIFPFILLNCV